MGGHLTVRVVVVREGFLEEESGIQNGPDERVGGRSKEWKRQSIEVWEGAGWRPWTKSTGIGEESQGLTKLEGSPGARSCRYLEGQEKHFGSYSHGNGKHCRYSRREVLWLDSDFIKMLDRGWVEKQGWLWGAQLGGCCRPEMRNDGGQD